MQSANNIAFKEWAVVCAALGQGRQTIILRKGGIAEGREGFRVRHGEFWLLPTQFHQELSQLAPDAEPLWRQVRAQPPPPAKFQVDLYAEVHATFEVREIDVLARLTTEHILSPETIEQRFHYRQPGLFVLVVRTYCLPTPYELSDSPYVAGCKSWVELPQALATIGAVPVLGEAEFAERLRQIERLVHGDSRQ